jgi:hypothetical protein
MNTITHVRAKLSCHHTIEVPEGQPEGATVSCEKCPLDKDGNVRTRRIKRLLGVCPLPEGITDIGRNIVAAADNQPSAETLDKAAAAVCAIEDAAEDPELVAQLAASIAAAEAAKPQASNDRAERLDLAKAEHKALKNWQANGRQGEAPATPNLDAMNADYAAGVKPSKRAKSSTPRIAPVRKPGHRFFRRGNPFTDRENKLSNIAWQCTKGLGDDGGRLNTVQLTQLLTDAGITDPYNTEWSLTLPNGVLVEARVLSASEVQGDQS